MPSVPDEWYALILLLKNIQHARKQVKIILALKISSCSGNRLCMYVCVRGGP
jgi:hypothetical protein